NSPGVQMLYTAANRSLAMAEVAVHLTLATLPPDFVMLTINIPDNARITKILPSSLPPNWNVFPPHASTQQIGDDFIRENKYLLLRVPSAVTKGDFNYLVNTAHPDFEKLKVTSVEKFPFDIRIFKT
ncbi:MAG: RES domain-containing protein, partial [Chitinophagaceae bacterium]